MVQKIRQAVLHAGGLVASDAVAGSPPTPNTGVTLVSDEAKCMREMRFSVSGLVATVLAADDYGSVKLLDLPDKNLLLASLELDLVGTKAGGLIAATDMDFAVGTAVASNQTLATTMLDVIEKIDLDADVIGAVIQIHSNDQSTAAYPLRIADSATTALYLNLGIPVGVADGTVTFAGTVVLKFWDLGNEIS